MRTPWGKLLEYGTAFAVFTVIVTSGLILLAAVGIAVVLTKISVFIK